MKKIILFFLLLTYNFIFCQAVAFKDKFSGEPIYFEPVDKLPVNSKIDDVVFKKSTDGKLYKRIFDGAVNTKWYGAKGDRNTDDAKAIQDAVDMAIALNLAVDIFGKSYISKPVNIDRLVDGAAFDSYFKVMTSCGGGIITKSNIPVFSSRIKYDTKPVSQLILFDGLNFEAENNNLETYVLDQSKLLRVQFNACSFSKIKLLNSPKNYIQSIYINNCNIRRFKGIFLNSGNVTFDLKVSGCIIESGEGTAFSIMNPQGCSFVSNTIEGISVAAIKYGGSRGLNISGNYFEENGIDIDGRSFGGKSAGVALTGNFFFHKENEFSVLWGQTSGCVSIGNWHNGSMHFLDKNSEISINDSVEKKVSNVEFRNILLK